MQRVKVTPYALDAVLGGGERTFAPGDPEWYSPRVRVRPPQAPAEPVSRTKRDAGGLTQREREVLVLVMRGRTDAQIAAQVGINHQSVKNLLAHLRVRYDVTNRPALVAHLIFAGVLRADEYHGDAPVAD